MDRVMQSDGNSFGEDVVKDSCKMASRDEDNILYIIQKGKYFRIFIMQILNFKIIERNEYLNKYINAL